MRHGFGTNRYYASPLPEIVKKYDIVARPRVRRTNPQGRFQPESQRKGTAVSGSDILCGASCFCRERWHGPGMAVVDVGMQTSMMTWRGFSWQTELESIAHDNGSLGKSIRNDIRS